MCPQNRNDRPTPHHGSGAAIAGFVEDRGLRRLFDYWRGKRNGHLMPTRDAIDPIDICWALPRVFLMDYDPDGGFRYRLAGAEIAEVFGRGNLKGLRFCDLLPPDGARVVEARWAQIAEGPSAVSMKGLVYLAAERAPIGERVVLPLSDTPGGPMTGVLGMTVCQWVAGAVPQEVRQSPMKFLPVAEIP